MHLQNLGVAREKAYEIGKEEREKNRKEAIALAVEKGNAILTRKEVAKILGISADGVSILAHKGYLDITPGPDPKTMYITKESCARFIHDFLRGVFEVEDLQTLTRQDQESLEDGKMSLLIALQNGAFD